MKNPINLNKINSSLKSIVTSQRSSNKEFNALKKEVASNERARNKSESKITETLAFIRKSNAATQKQLGVIEGKIGVVAEGVLETGKAVNNINDSIGQSFQNLEQKIKVMIDKSAKENAGGSDSTIDPITGKKNSNKPTRGKGGLFKRAASVVGRAAKSSVGRAVVGTVARAGAMAVAGAIGSPLLAAGAVAGAAYLGYKALSGGGSGSALGAAGSTGNNMVINTGDKIGKLSAKYESGNKGTEAVGWDSTGGTSYGKYQIATKTGTMSRFLQYLSKANPEAFKVLQAAGDPDAGKDGPFAVAWKQLAKEGKLSNEEHEFIKKSHFDAAISSLKDKQLVELISSNRALQEVMWSTSVQHGAAGAAGIFNKAFKPNMTIEELINVVYEMRSTKFGSSTEAVRQSVLKRFREERDGALSINSAGGATAAADQKAKQNVKTDPKEKVAGYSKEGKPVLEKDLQKGQPGGIDPDTKLEFVGLDNSFNKVYKNNPSNANNAASKQAAGVTDSSKVGSTSVSDLSKKQDDSIVKGEETVANRAKSDTAVSTESEFADQEKSWQGESLWNDSWNYNSTDKKGIDGAAEANKLQTRHKARMDVKYEESEATQIKAGGQYQPEEQSAVSEINATRKEILNNYDLMKNIAESLGVKTDTFDETIRDIIGDNGKIQKALQSVEQIPGGANAVDKVLNKSVSLIKDMSSSINRLSQTQTPQSMQQQPVIIQAPAPVQTAQMQNPLPAQPIQYPDNPRNGNSMLQTIQAAEVRKML